MDTESITMNKATMNKFLAGLLLGAAIGGVMALLYAPQSGTETRRIVKEKALAIKEKASKAIDTIKGSADSLRKTKG